jgi:phosphoribosyl 1,2-cyclic phosphodiesterase
MAKNRLRDIVIKGTGHGSQLKGEDPVPKKKEEPAVHSKAPAETQAHPAGGLPPKASDPLKSKNPIPKKEREPAARSSTPTHKGPDLADRLLPKTSVYFWGTRGAPPVSITAEIVRKKVAQAVRERKNRRFATNSEIDKFVDEELSFIVRGSYGTNTPCIEIRGNEEYVICDAGTGLRDLGNDHTKKVEQGLTRKTGSVFNIFVSHLHWGHIQGFPFFAPAYIPGNEVRIYGFHKDIREAFARQQSSLYSPTPPEHMKADLKFITLEEGKEYDIGGFKVRGIKQSHPGDSYGYRFEKDGKAIVYSTDAEHKTSWDQQARSDHYPFIDFFRDADLLIFDSQYDWSEATLSKHDHGHSSYIPAVELSVKSNVKHLCLFHTDPVRDDASLNAFLADAREYLRICYDEQSGPHPMKMDLAYDGLILEV